jgi:hypothetical protein
MSSKDRFTIPLNCPSCNRSGEADCSQEDGYTWMNGHQSTYVENVTPGFSRVEEPSYWGKDINFVCDDCGDLCANH